MCAQKEASRRAVHILPIRTVSRQGNAHKAADANRLCFQHGRRFSLSHEKATYAETFCGKVSLTLWKDLNVPTKRAFLHETWSVFGDFGMMCGVT